LLQASARQLGGLCPGREGVFSKLHGEKNVPEPGECAVPAVTRALTLILPLWVTGCRPPLKSFKLPINHVPKAILVMLVRAIALFE